MGMDGLSMANTGALKESTSADFASRTEQSMQADRTNDAKQVQTLSTNPRIKEKDEEEESKKQKQEQKPQEDIEDSFVPSENEFEKEEFHIEDLENPSEIFEGFITALNHEYDPRFLFMILALTLFLADVAVRKFKFKWPHEIIREYREKKSK
jgi:hypothetical protein